MRLMKSFRLLTVLVACLVVHAPLAAAELVGVNDWGGGFIATFEHTVSAEDAPQGAVSMWKFNVNYSGSAQLNNAWMTGYNGSISTGEANGVFEIFNQGFAPEISVGSTLTFNIQGNGGFDAADFLIDFESLDPAGNGAFDSSFVSVNDWFNPSWGGGFNATFQCVVTSAVPVEEFIAEFNYSGAGEPSSAWAQSYNGSIETGYIGRDGGYAVRSTTGNGYRPTLTTGANFRVVIQVNGAGFNAADFDFRCYDASNIAPVADAGSDLSGSVGSIISLSGAGSSDENGDPLTYQWSIVSVPDGSQASLNDASAESPSLQLDVAGEYEITLVVNDGALDSEADSLLITAANSTLTALPRAVPTFGDAPLAVTFSPDANTDNAIELYEWDFDGDGTIDRRETVGGNFTYTYQDSGVYLAALTVTDSNGDTSTSTLEINVGNEAPVVTAEATPSNGGIPLVVSFSANATDDNGIQDYAWDFDGDGVVDATTTSSTTQFNYEQQGVFQPILTVQDTLGAATTLQVPSVEVRAGPPGTPTVSAGASVTSGTVPLTVALSAAVTNLGGATVSEYEWDLDGDGAYESSGSTGNLSHVYNAPGRFFTRVRVTTSANVTAEDVVEIVVLPSVALSVSEDTIDIEMAGLTSVDTVLGGTTNVSVVIEDADGTLVRTLVPATLRLAGEYSDEWDGRNDAGEFVPEGQYRAILLYDYDGATERLDLGLSTGGRQYNPPRTRIPSSFQPYADNPLVIDFTLSSPAEITAFMGRFNVNTRIVTFFQRDAFGRGTHRVTWHGENSDGQLIHPPAGDSFLFGIWAYELPDNAIYVQNKIDVDALAAAPPIFTPTGRETVSDISFTLDKPGSVEIVINDASSGVACRTEIVTGLAAGENVWQWDGQDDNGNFVAPGSYRIGVTGNDANGGKSLTQYTLQRVYY